MSKKAGFADLVAARRSGVRMTDKLEERLAAEKPMFKELNDEEYRKVVVERRKQSRFVVGKSELPTPPGGGTCIPSHPLYTPPHPSLPLSHPFLCHAPRQPHTPPPQHPPHPLIPILSLPDTLGYEDDGEDRFSQGSYSEEEEEGKGKGSTKAVAAAPAPLLQRANAPTAAAAPPKPPVSQAARPVASGESTSFPFPSLPFRFGTPYPSLLTHPFHPLFSPHSPPIDCSPHGTKVRGPGGHAGGVE